MLDLGFEKELTRISRALRNKDKQSVLCSATFPEGVQRLAADFLDPSYYFISVGVVGSTHSKIAQRFEWMELPYRNTSKKGTRNPRVDAVIKNVNRFWNSKGRNPKQSSVIVFSNTKEGVEEIGHGLCQKFGNKRIRVIHGDKEQSHRNKAIGKKFMYGVVHRLPTHTNFIFCLQMISSLGGRLYSWLRM
jgi:probable ATP-dependent RNA helicase DDX4